MRVRSAAPLASPRVLARLGQASWLILALGTGSTFLLPGTSDDAPTRIALVVTLVLFFAALTVRLGLIAVTVPSRRVPIVSLAIGVLLWAAGSGAVSASLTTAPVAFPAPGEVLCLLSYLGMACFIQLDVPRRTALTGAVVLEAVVVCCGAACLAAFFVLLPMASSHTGVVPQLLAMLYPVIDLVLGLLLLAQMMLGSRERSRGTAMMLLGFLGLAIADSNFLLRLSTDLYSSNLVLDALWGVSFGAIVGGACARRGTPSARVADQHDSALLGAAAALAVAALVVHPAGVMGWVVTVPAVVTLVGTGARLLLALHEARRTAESLRLSLTDELTGLPNRRALIASAERALLDGRPIALLVLDLDGFKDINDSLGHMVGDEVLVALGCRLRAAYGQEVAVVRLGGDEFGLLVPATDVLTLFEVAQHARAELRAPLRVERLDVAIDASVGIALGTVGEVTGIELLRRADVAMSEAKRGRAGVLLFDPVQDGPSRHRLRRGEELRAAIAGGELEVWYQPQIEARTRQVVAMEALVRWQHPTEGLLAPIAFLPDVRRAGLMSALTEVVMTRAVEDARRWRDAGLVFRVAINVSPPELIGGQVLPVLFDLLEKSGLPGRSLLVEVTEDSFLADPERAREALYELRRHEVEVSIDDYGTGFSSLAYLRDLPVQELKMDRSFVSSLLSDERSQMIVQTTTQLARALGLRIVAEGVEDAETAATLVPLGIDVFQGYYVARPMLSADVAPWVVRWSSRTPTGPVPAVGSVRPALASTRPDGGRVRRTP